ncbi:GspE/PulE family protein [Ferrimonas balearica]|uniref:GspE/PulE family protein n=1 Tax=Ferrimonas balearica TaxID=44012 RepID=UPI001C57B24F|nr:GspE/PulE family protein [Ferrimonas balearica]MBW3140965.1 Flp pilus assembly complex ATPase component TadA [Ferrimonas balearica]MBW3165835.1 Flp pilus assembly complex ATPase component TadA [Ferrimonas balearica]MBY6108011.1 Flp pilus assembly complex ATPase component TadA [Ferrimonas balearica]
MKAKLKQRLGDLLVSEGIISEAQLMEALAAQKQSGRKLGRTLIDLHLISEEQLLSFLAQQMNIEFLDLSAHRIKPELVQLLPEVHARRYRALVVAGDDNELTVAMSDPADLAAIDTLETLLAPRHVNLAVATEGQLLDAFDNLYRHTDKIASIAGELHEEYSAQSDFSLDALVAEDADNDTTVVRLLQSIFEDAVQVRASDIHIEPDEKLLRIRYRVDGQLMETTLSEYRVANALVLRIKLMAGLDISEKRLPQDGRFHMSVKNHEIDVRLSTMPVQFGESVVMRLLDQSAGLLRLEETGMPADLISRVRNQIKRPHGMILVTGPTGSGKTTSLYAMLNELNQAESKIITVEDPVEYRLPRISQVQVNHKIGLDFSSVLRTTLRQDPDIIMVGEMRDQETVEIGLRGALTGHLVLSTLHTNDAISSTLRLIDMGAAPYLVASALRAIIAQRLVRRVCPHCAQPHELSPGEKAWLSHVGGEALLNESFKRGRGCQHCNQSGYRGRIGVYEMLELDEPMVEALRRANPDAFAQAVRQSGQFRPLALAALDYARQGITTLEEAMRLVEDASDLGGALAQRVTDGEVR